MAQHCPLSLMPPSPLAGPHRHSCCCTFGVPCPCPGSFFSPWDLAPSLPESAYSFSFSRSSLCAVAPSLLSVPLKPLVFGLLCFLGLLYQIPQAGGLTQQTFVISQWQKLKSETMVSVGPAPTKTCRGKPFVSSSFWWPQVSLARGSINSNLSLWSHC